MLKFGVKIFQKSYEEIQMLYMVTFLMNQKKHSKHIFGVGVGLLFLKIWIKIMNIRASAEINWFLWKHV